MTQRAELEVNGGSCSFVEDSVSGASVSVRETARAGTRSICGLRAVDERVLAPHAVWSARTRERKPVSTSSQALCAELVKEGQFRAVRA